MKTTFKIFLAVTGMSAATIVTSSNLKASSKVAAKAGHCANTSATCGTTIEGTKLNGTWTEGTSPGT